VAPRPNSRVYDPLPSEAISAALRIISSVVSLHPTVAVRSPAAWNASPKNATFIVLRFEL